VIAAFYSFFTVMSSLQIIKVLHVQINIKIKPVSTFVSL